MPSTLLLGNRNLQNGYIEDLVQSLKIGSLAVTTHKEQVKIESARELKRILSFKESSPKLIVFEEGLTIEAQNALLKTIEESSDFIHFIFFVEKKESLLPTIQSRSFIVTLKTDDQINGDLYEMLKDVKTGNLSHLRLEEMGSYFKENSLDDLLPVLRRMLIENCDNENVFVFFLACKRAIRSVSLATVNNVNSAIVLESIFSTKLPLDNKKSMWL